MDPSGLYTDRQVADCGSKTSRGNGNVNGNGTGTGATSSCCHHTHDSTRPSSSHQSQPQHTRAVLEHQLHERNQRGWRRIVLNFTPSWFSVTMGTGIVSILLHNLPYNAGWLRWISVVVFALNVLLFVTFTFISLVRYTVYKGLFFAMLSHPVQSLFLGTFPMGLATIVNMILFVCVPAWGTPAITLAWTLWWIDVVIAVACCMFLPFAIMHIHTTSAPKLQTMTAVWLLPIVSTIVASASGGIVAESLVGANRPTHALWTLITSYILWGTGVPLAMVILVMYFHRLTVYQLPPREVIVSVFLPLGPLGQGAFAIMQLGKVAKAVFPIISRTLDTQLLDDAFQGHAGDALYVVSFALGLIMWGYGLVWLFFALASVTRTKFPFNMGWWGFTFPLGVYTVATTTFASELPSTFFRVLGTILSLAVVMLWIVVAGKTALGAWEGSMFFAPCAADFEKKWIERELQWYDRSREASETALERHDVEKAGF